jgi:hypothetical protein
MPQVEITKFKVRRGTDEQRQLLVFEQGEFAYTVDTKRLYVGDGATLGGVSAGAKIHPSLLNTYSLTGVIAEIGDIVPVNKTFWQLTASDYTQLSSWEIRIIDVDPVVFSFDSTSTLQLNTSSISAIYLDPISVSNGIMIDSGILQSNFNTKSLEISAYQLSLKASGIDEREISSSALGGGLSGGSNQKIGLYADFNSFYFDANGMTKLSGYNPFTLRFDDINSDWIGAGLSYNLGVSSLSTTITDVDDSGTITRDAIGRVGLNTAIFGAGLHYDSNITSLSTNLVSCDNISIVKSSEGIISIKNDAVSGTNEWAKITVDQFGRVTNQTSSIFQTLTGSSSSGSYNVTNSLSAIFNGDPSGVITSTNITRFTALSADGQVVTLSSAGFICFEGAFTTRMGQSVGRFAIPIFKY